MPAVSCWWETKCWDTGMKLNTRTIILGRGGLQACYRTYFQLHTKLMEGHWVCSFWVIVPQPPSCKELYSGHGFTVKTSVPLPSFPWWISSFDQLCHHSTWIKPEEQPHDQQWLQSRGTSALREPRSEFSLGFPACQIGCLRAGCLPAEGRTPTAASLPVCQRAGALGGLFAKSKVKRSWTILTSDSCNNIQNSSIVMPPAWQIMS